MCPNVHMLCYIECMYKAKLHVSSVLPDPWIGETATLSCTDSVDENHILIKFEIARREGI